MVGYFTLLGFQALVIATTLAMAIIVFYILYVDVDHIEENKLVCSSRYKDRDIEIREAKGRYYYDVHSNIDEMDFIPYYTYDTVIKALSMAFHYIDEREENK